jgi:hypothetical protein
MLENLDSFWPASQEPASQEAKLKTREACVAKERRVSPAPAGGYWAAAAIGCCAVAAGRLAFRKLPIWRSASWICSGFAFHG